MPRLTLIAVTLRPAARLRGVACCAASLCAVCLLAGCTATLKPKDFAGTGPAFDPVAFWTGRTSSWGVIENRGGAPTAIVTTATEGTPEGDGGLHMIQHVTTGGKTTVRDWHIRRTSPGHFEATANDVVGTARGAPSGRTLHWTWTLAAKPGNGLYNVKMDQWMYLADNGTLLNRTTVTKLGVRIAEISEQFVREPKTGSR